MQSIPMVEVSDKEELSLALKAIRPCACTAETCLIDDWPTFEFKEEADLFKMAGDYRKREFNAGRKCLRGALEKFDVVRLPIPSDCHGVPIFPEGYLGCISHSRGLCAAIAGKKNDFRALGLDLEMTNRLSASAIDRTVHPIEETYVKGDQVRASLIFCAKEAFFKAQFPLWHTHANFRDVAFRVDAENQSLHIEWMDKRYPEALRALAGEFYFNYRYFGAFVVTICWIAA